MYMNYKNTMRKCNQIHKSLFKQWKSLQNKFISQFRDIKKQPRIEIHIPSLSFPEHQRNTIDMYKFKQSLQLSRLFRCKDPNVKIIYILP